MDVRYKFDNRFHKDNVNGLAPYFVFGDFNFRCDTEGVVKVGHCVDGERFIFNETYFYLDFP